MSQVSRSASALPPQRRSDVETHVLPDGTSLLYDPIADVGYPLDLVRSLMWDLCDGTLTSEEIARELATLLPQHETAALYSLHVLDEFVARGLLEAQGDAQGAA